MNDVRRSAPALEVRGLDVYYGHSHALQGVDLTLDSGVFSLVGRNGMGKTTLCKTIMGLLRASGGSIRVRGQDVTSMSPAGIARPCPHSSYALYFADRNGAQSRIASARERATKTSRRAGNSAGNGLPYSSSARL